jgi:serine protease Do
MPQSRRNWFLSSFCFFALCTTWLASPLAAAQDDMSEAISNARGLSRAFREAAETAMPSVVTLITKSKPDSARDRSDLRRLLEDPRFRRLLPDQLPGESQDGQADLPAIPTAVGSGVIIDSAGVILTNNHVVQGADEIVARLGNGQEFKVVDVKTDPLSELAIVRIKPDANQPLQAARLGDSEPLQIGDWVIAIGSPFELEATVSAGIISGKGRGIDKVRRGRLLQTDAAINPGNSGGPLVNLEGQVVGINTAIASMSGGYQGIGFAIPIDRAKWITQELLTHGKVRRASLGISIEELTPEAAVKLKLPARSGVFVRDVLPASPADAAGIKINDVIVEFAGQRTPGPRDLQDLVEQKPIGSQQPVKVMRDGAAVSMSVTLQELKEDALRGRP